MVAVTHAQEETPPVPPVNSDDNNVTLRFGG
eukprot:CAMPEP_0198707960 /NCGR_PEP_ID=MMETSP1471-20131121/773_1 /TAXON_ID=41880 /ORGANISM="Pycnococcus provasolii, Strain RCC733" /LENGTH=30 /DNA_ID= /DNA_START= /DNA_END= /DNA_ORIENTATION=